MSLLRVYFYGISLLIPALFSGSSQAAGERLIEAILKSDFQFDRNISNVPFFPLGYLSASYHDALEIDAPISSPSNTEFSYRSFNQGFGLPVWVGKKDMLILGESIELDRLDFGNRAVDMNTAGILLAWISQPSAAWQMGAFGYWYNGFNEDAGISSSSGNYSGFIGRYRHKERFHTYWGLVRVKESHDTYYYPYAGFDWYIGHELSLSMVLPWPTLNYAPNNNELYKVGALFSGNEWEFDVNNAPRQNSFSKVDFGVSYEKRLKGMTWFEIGAGYSGFGHIVLDEHGDSQYDSEISGEPYIRIAINLRPES